MAALIHHCHHPATDSPAFSPSSHPIILHSHHLSKPFTPSQITSYLSPSKTSLSLSSSKTLLFPSFPLSKIPSFQHLFSPKHPENPQPLSNHELSRLLKLSIDYTDIQLNKAVHASILKIQQDIRLFNSLISSYIELGHLTYAERVFNSILSPDVVSYTAMMSGLAKSNREIEAVGLFFEMRGLGIEPNGYTFVALLTACMRLLDLELGSQIHAFAVKTGHFNCSYVANALMALYGKCSCFDYAVKLFDDMPQRDIASWNTVISCMVKDGMCSATTKGIEIHAYAHKIGYETNLSVKNALIEFYAKCGRVEDVETLFDKMPVRDVFTWTEMVNAYMGFGLVDLALELFVKMPEKNSVSYNSLLAGFCQNGEGFRALRLFCRIVEEGVEISDFTLTTILHACGLTKDLRMDDAEMIFRRSPLKQSSSIMLTTMICGYARNSDLEKAISLICQWQNEEDNLMDEFASASILVGNAIVSMYSKCGNMEEAAKAFDKMSEHDIVSWNSLLAGYILNRLGEKALEIWKRMQKREIQPDKVTCVLIITAYRHTNSNLVEHCNDFFFSMKSIYHIEPNSDHYTSWAGVLGYWGLLEEAEDIIKNMPFEPKASVWRALLDSCRVHRNATIGKRAAKNILGIEPQDPSTYILKSNLYSASEDTSFVLHEVEEHQKVNFLLYHSGKLAVTRYMLEMLLVFISLLMVSAHAKITGDAKFWLV
ncbi:hypothetical protein DH2020_026192 [Rehmannia glutinosa]|uniref:Pentatricopeptide repeat-containing protein n=1 Tax=Rehmannia glutinosa TaxID=99300 RepID=A0ABR0VXK6_REHGL